MVFSPNSIFLPGSAMENQFWNGLRIEWSVTNLAMKSIFLLFFCHWNDKLSNCFHSLSCRRLGATLYHNVTQQRFGSILSSWLCDIVTTWHPELWLGWRVGRADRIYNEDHYAIKENLKRYNVLFTYCHTSRCDLQVDIANSLDHTVIMLQTEWWRNLDSFPMLTQFPT